MPSHTIPSALVSLFVDGNGAPWQHAKWQEITGVKHGLFPQDDSHLPSGWTRAVSDSIKAYFSQFSNISTEDARIKFASSRSGGVIPGRDAFRSWITSNWAKWKIHSRISDVFTARDIHPITLYSKDPSLRNKQVSAFFIPLVLDDLAVSLFGEDSLEDDGRVGYTLRTFLQHIAQRTWMVTTRQMSRSKQKLAALEAAARVSFEDLDRDKLTKAKILTVIRAVHRWKTLAEVFSDSKTSELIAQMDDELQHLMEGLGARPKSKPVKLVKKAPLPKLCNVEKSSLQQLAKQEEVDEIIKYFVELIEVEDTSPTGPAVDPTPTLSIPFAEPAGNEDPGVEVEARMSSDQLAKNLGFHFNLPLPFNRHRHPAGLTAWDPNSSHLFASENPSPELLPIRLHWHQIAGVHAIVRKIFSSTPQADHCPGVLLADEVGLGKTFQAGALIAFLSDLVLRQEKRLALPPLIVQQPFLGEDRVLPKLPHLIIVPGTLLGQWENELRVILKPASFDIFVYGLGKQAQEAFWDPSAPFAQSVHSSNRIVIASHSAVINDFSRLFKSSRTSGRKVPWAPRARVNGFDTRVLKTLYGQRYLSVTLDEAHEFRNTTKHVAALTLVELARFRVIATATPLQTSNQDTAAMGRLCGIRHFLSEAAHAEEKMDTTNLRRAKKELAELNADMEAEMELTGHEDGDGDADNDEAGAGGRAKELRENPLKLCQIEISRRHQKQFDGRVIRRTAASVDYEGKPVLPLPKCNHIVGLVDLTEREKKIINVISDNVKDDVSNAIGSKKISTKSFYIEYRMAVGYAQEARGPIPHFNTLEEWEQAKSTKMDVIARIIRHTLSSDKAPPVKFADGKPVFPPVPPLAPGEVPRNKVVVFQEFPSLGRVLRNVVFDLYDIQYLYIDGQTPFRKRTQIIHQFNTDPTIRTLIFSSVGSVGLNLSRANTILFLDHPWSDQDVRQICGRVHRQPQDKEVNAYLVLAKETSDVIMCSSARSKRDMMEAFLSKQKFRELFALLSGKMVVENDGAEIEDEIEEDEEVERRTKKKSKQKAKVALPNADSGRLSEGATGVDKSSAPGVDGLQETLESASGYTSSEAMEELNRTDISDGDVSMRSNGTSAMSETSEHRSPSPEEVRPQQDLRAGRGPFVIPETPPTQHRQKRGREESMSPTDFVQRRTARSSPGPPARSFNSLFTPAAPRRVSHVRTPSPRPRLPALFTPPTQEELEETRAEMLHERRTNANHPNLTVSAARPPQRAPSVVSRMISTQGQQSATIAQPVPRRPSMPSLSKELDGARKDQVRGSVDAPPGGSRSIPPNPFARKPAPTRQAVRDKSPPAMRRHASSPGPSSLPFQESSGGPSNAGFGLSSRRADRNGSPPPLTAPIRKKLEKPRRRAF